MHRDYMPPPVHSFTSSPPHFPFLPRQTWDSWNMADDQSLKNMLKPLAIGACCVNGLSLVLLSLLAFSDPGILPKYTTAKAPDWTYSMQGLSYRPPGAIFCKKTKGGLVQRTYNLHPPARRWYRPTCPRSLSYSLTVIIRPSCAYRYCSDHRGL